jgi:membrane protein YdbS with pleckstrin-like domain
LKSSVSGVKVYLVYNWMIYVPKMPQAIVDYLMPQEDVVVAVRQHPIAIAKPGLLIVAGLAAAAAVTAVGSVGSEIHLLLAWAAWKIIDWRYTYFIITENRLMLVTGVFSKNVGMMPLAKVTDMRLERSPTGRALGYGKFVIESAGQEQALRDVPFVPYPQQLYQEILAMIFPKKPSGRPGDDPGS